MPRCNAILASSATAIALTISLTTACIPALPDYDRFDHPAKDFDGDGVVEADGDCNDQDPTTFPGAPEICDGLDNNCDSLIDNDATDQTAWYFDSDGDGYGLSTTEKLACDPPSDQFVSTAGDCNDTAAHINPGAPEVCDGGTDEDCDGLVDTADDSVTGNATWYRDRDGDGHGDPNETVDSCEVLPGYALFGDDCDDTSNRVHPDHPEECDSVDNDCDGLIDDADGDVTDPATWHPDADSDGYGDPSTSVESCDPPSGHVAAPDNGAYDCDDTDAAIFPGQSETCNNLDDDCDGLADEGVTTTFFADFDGDGFGDINAPVEACTAPSGTLLDTSDCDDSNAAIYPGADELCGDNLDNNCNASIDEDTAIDATTWYLDADGDSFGDPTVALTRCIQPISYVADATDCEDGRANVNPGATETCLTLYDDNCDGHANDPNSASCTDWYADADSDGYGDSTDTLCQCTPDAAHPVADATDCDDTLSAVNPAQLEDCTTAVDDDCTGSTNDENAQGCTNFFYDFDGDDYGLTTDRQCLCNENGAYAALASDDCDDTDPSVNPGATEVCFDAVDNDCSGTADGPDASDASTWSLDADADGFGSGTLTQAACDQPSGYVADGTDCDDGRDNVFPGATETCGTAYDDNCDGNANDLNAVSCDDYYRDDDGDNYGLASDTLCRCSEEGAYTSRVPTDCDDTNAGISPAATETCDTPDDEDCDGTADESEADNCTEYFHDADGDNYGINDSVCTCTGFSPYTATNMGDCNENDITVNVGFGNCGIMGDVTGSEAAAVTSGGTYHSELAFLGGFDYNGDGYDDLLFGTPGYDHGTYQNVGAAFLFLGPAIGSLDLADPGGGAYLFFSGGTTHNTYAGSHVSTGDFDGDGAVELLVSGSVTDTLWVVDDAFTVLGDLDPTSAGVTEYAYGTGESIGDVDGDGADDAIFCPNDSGYLITCTVAYGSAAGLVASGTNLVVHTGIYQVAGTGNTSSGDLNGDGVSDFASMTYNGAYIVLGVQGTGLAGSASTNVSDSSYYSYIDILPDLTGDGYADLVVTDPGNNPGVGILTHAGIVAILPGGATLPVATALAATGTSIRGDTTYDEIGYDADAADVDGDGVHDLLVSSYSNNERPRLFYGPITPGTYSIGDSDARFTSSFNHYQGVANAGDTNADGYDDFLVGHINASYGPVYLFLGTYN